MRGTPECSMSKFGLPGIIPALAGNTSVRRWRCFYCWDHPRACGEHKLQEAMRKNQAGSSPRLRGTLMVPTERRINNGIIPALAGNTNWCRCGYTCRWDHPRACGEHLMESRTHATRAGSSPRLRGTLLSIGLIGLLVGIIPALAGNTYRQCSQPIKPWDHPRACGEHAIFETPRFKRAGSSPRLRGTRSLLICG